MEKQDLILLKEKLNKLNEKEKDLRDIYLKKISNGDILGPMTGYPSIDKPALAFYDDKYITAQMPNMTATEFLKKMNEKNMNLPAIDCSDGIITYQDLFEMIDKTAKSLYQIGAKKGKIIVGMLPSDTAHEVYLLYGACSSGSAVSFTIPNTPINTLCSTINNLPTDYFFVSNDYFTLEMEESIYKNTHIKNIINVSSNPNLTNDKRTISWTEFLSKGNNFELPQINRSPKDLLFISKTGGSSTGEPKNVMLNDNDFNIMVHQLLNSDLDYSVGDKWLRIWSLFSASAAISSSHLALCAGMVNVLRKMPEPQNFAKLFMEEKPNHLCLVSALIDLLIYSGLTKDDIKGFIKTAGIGGESITPQFEKRAKEFLPTYLGYGYGCTENSSSAVMRMNKETAISGTIGIPLVKTTVGIFNPDTLEELSYNEEGEICIKSYTQMIGYYNDQKLTKEVLKQHQDGSTWIHTGDLGIINEKGFVSLTGRIKRFIFVYTGEKVYPVVLENIISEVPGVIKVSVVSAPDKNHDEYFVPTACIVVDKKYNTEDVRKKVIEACCNKLPNYAFPQDIIIKEDLPYLASGKPNLKKMESDIARGMELAKKIQIKL